MSHRSARPLAKISAQRILTFLTRSLLNDLDRGEQPTYDVDRRTMLNARNNGWITGRRDRGSLAITEKGREALRLDRDALTKRDQDRLVDSRNDPDQGP